MFLLDDILLRSLGVTVPGLDLIWVLERVGNHAKAELYDPAKISDELKENRLLYELGEKSVKEYKARHEELNEKLLVANEVREKMRADAGADLKLL